MSDARICPVCQRPLQEEHLHTQVIDRCEQCNGIYFDRGELESIVEIVNMYQGIELTEPDIVMIPEPEKHRALRCPVDKTVMAKHELAGHIIDICPQCQGIWLDDNEIGDLKITQKHIKDNIRLYIKLGH